MTTKAVVVGASGYAGAELLSLLAGHPEISVALACAGEKAGEPVGAVHPQLAGVPDYEEMIFAPTDPALMQQADLIFIALPHGQSAALVASLPASAKLVDLGADFRLASAADWAEYYGGTHAGTWTYGLPELPGARAAISSASRIANPGCYATAVALALWPAHAAGLIDATDISVVAASGTTGAGRKPTDSLLASTVMGSISAYKVGGVHQHTPEMEQTISSVGTGEVVIGFTPYLAPMTRGIIATCTARTSATEAELRSAFEQAYTSEPFVTVLPEGQWPHTSSVSGTNGAQIQIARDEHTGRLVIISVIDNLGKGAAGQAIQNANLMLGLPETLGLPLVGGAA
jgi:N-acetyl-gamma-glutamyl-phosphate reductase